MYITEFLYPSNISSLSKYCTCILKAVGGIINTFIKILIWFQEAVLKFDYSVANERDVAISGKWGEEEEEMESMRTVMIIPADKITQIMIKLQDVLALPT